jgi:hypothetical protein
MTTGEEKLRIWVVSWNSAMPTATIITAAAA